MDNEIVIYQSNNGALEIMGDFDEENIWASQAQISQIYDVDRTVITKHINSIFKNKEADEKSNVPKMHIANSDKPVKFYSLDIIPAVGYKTNSKVAIEFRKWATQTLRSHIVDGYTINPSRIPNYEKLMQVVDDIKQVLPETTSIKSQDILELIKSFAHTWSRYGLLQIN
ncbi:MAG: RhuM family protein [Armatimonadota bacterium]